MKSRVEVDAARIMLLIKLDAHSLFNRIKSRKIEYMNVFAAKRTRDHFAPIFFSRYPDVGFTELMLCPEECIISIDTFYNKVEEIYWFLLCTEDMPNTVEGTVDRYIIELEKVYDLMNTYIHVELGFEGQDAS